MRRRYILLLLAGAAVMVGSLNGWQREFREYPAIEYNSFPLPDDYKHPAE